ncbi:alpha-1,2-mannosyltransferase [Sporothrix brasiliensis 5110]|uniref:GDP-Man:Man(3)GlcNAc(2)-PP-Dol alpha-1,2-mannosyltransferase n=1 Tax=Sporothrix brasiliensis 5110 TaxID=1398154 RepID=A0A0C2FDN0_9PEZI|nr:alpha-1,2-mannosyltransferase [Sporothrix brasiliensis 5110]KIH89223.1 alpha-1,2-mannosyltransferase [Sporothrix brasiliensis 5110]
MDSGSCSAQSRCNASNGHGSGGSTYAVAAFITAVVLTGALLPSIWRLAGSTLGWYLRKRTESQRQFLLETMAADEKRFQEAKTQQQQRQQTTKKNDSSDDDWENVEAEKAASAGNGEKGASDWDGIVGFFHPFCNAGGGGERVLWAAIRATQQRWPKAKCVVYTGDHDVHKDAILARVRDRFNIHLHPPTVAFLYLSTRRWVLASTWPHFTLAGQSFGSIIMAWDALSLLVPDIFVDTMGYAFALGFSKLLFRTIPTGAYVHYPTISTDMLASLDPQSTVGSQGVNAGQGVGMRGRVKRAYWKAFAWLYASVGSSIDVVMTNSSWTQGHVQAIWGPLRAKKGKSSSSQTTGGSDIAVVYPPVAVSELEHEVDVSAASEATREKVLLYIAQFRPEKNHHLVLQAFAAFLKKQRRQQQNRTTKSGAKPADTPKLVLVGSVRDDSDSKRVYQLRLLTNELNIRDDVEFQLDAPWPAILEWLRRASVGVNCMWNEHFGIGVVEYQAAGLISVVHNSGGPKLDIVTDIGGLPTGFHATTADEFAAGFEQALALPDPLAWRERARQSAKRFTEEEFERKWLEQMDKLVALLK